MNETSAAQNDDITVPSHETYSSLWKQSSTRLLGRLRKLAESAVGEEAYNNYIVSSAGPRPSKAISALAQHLIKRHNESDESVEMNADTVFNHACEWAPILSYDLGEDKGFIVFLLFADMSQENLARLYETGDLKKASRLIISGVPVNEVMNHESLNRNQATDSPVE
jgi:hypothetical protein